MEKRMIAESVLKFVFSAGVGAVVGNAVKASTPLDINIPNKILVAIGTMVVTEYLGNNGGEYMLKKFEGVLNRLGPKTEEK